MKVTEVGRYLIGDRIASGGTANVHLGRLRGAAGFVRAVAIKTLHPALTRDAEFVAAMIDEAHVASSIRHPNVVPILDVLSEAGDLYLIMEYVHGDSLAQLIKESKRRGQPVAPDIAVGVAVDFLRGLHAAHEAVDDRGAALAIVHRDIAPKNIMVGVDGVSRVVDFGIAKAAVRAQTTQEGQLKGTLGYMSPEQLGSTEIDRRTDIFASGIVVWELLTGRRLFQADSAGEVVGRVLLAPIAPPKSLVAALPSALDRAVMQALARDPASRYATAQHFADALADALPPASSRDIGAWVADLAAEKLAARTRSMRAATGEPSAPTRSAQEEATAPTAQDRPLASPGSSASAPIIVADEAAVALTPAPDGRRGRRATAIATIGVGVALGVSLKLFWAGAAPQSASTPPTEVSIDDVVASAPVSSPSGIETSLAVPTPLASVVVSAPTASVSVVPSVTPVRGTARRPDGGAPPDCNPPYVMKGGIKHIKPQCL